MSGTIAIESPNDRAIRSIPSISSFPGKSAAIRQYPGINKTSGRAKIIRRGLELRRGRYIVEIERISQMAMIKRSAGKYFLKREVIRSIKLRSCGGIFNIFLFRK